MMKILNLYAGIGGNRKLWGDEHEITAVENVQHIADVYSQLYPNDTVVVADAHQYLLEHFQEFDFIWSSPPCPTHSRVSTGLTGWGIYRYPDMSLYQEILFLKHFYKGKWLVENVVPYYTVLVAPRLELDRHLFWSNFAIPRAYHPRTFKGAVTDATKEALSESYDIILPDGTLDQRKLLRNAVDPKLGLHIFNAAQSE
jgi:DNA (cytosine-5)-methyltransferase 1